MDNVLQKPAVPGTALLIKKAKKRQLTGIWEVTTSLVIRGTDQK